MQTESAGWSLLFCRVATLTVILSGCALDWNTENVPDSGDGFDGATTDPQGDAQTSTTNGGGGTPASCLVDRDGDGYGEDGTEEPCTGTPPLPGDCNDDDSDVHPAAHDACGDGVDNDCDGNVDEGAVEQCNGEDDDCDGAVDNGFLCVAGQTEVACTTECGTQGTRMCSDSCEAAAANQCVPPAEVCNGIDDDCDGTIDPGLWTPRDSFARAVTSASTDSGVKVLARPGGGAWLFFQDGDMLRAQLVEDSGRASTESPHSVAASDANWYAVDVAPYIVVATRQEDEKAWAVVIHILRASDLKVVDDYRLESPRTECSQLSIFDLAAYLDPNGNLRLGLVRSYGTGMYSATDPYLCLNTLKSQLELLLLSRSEVGLWSTPSSAHQYPPAQPGRLVPMSCKDEWLLLEARNLEDNRRTWLATRVSSSGEVIAQYATPVDHYMLLDALARPGCEGDSAEVTLVTAHSEDIESASWQTFLTTLRFDSVTGALTNAKTEQLQGVSFAFASASYRGDEVLVLGLDASEDLRLIENTRHPEALKSLSIAPRPGQQIPSLHGANFISVGGIFRRVSAAYAGSALVLAASAKTSPLLETYRKPGDTGPVVAMSYAVGCSP